MKLENGEWDITKIGISLSLHLFNDQYPVISSTGGRRSIGLDTPCPRDVDFILNPISGIKP